MKYLFIFSALFIVAAAVACKPKTECQDYNWNVALFYSKDSITDTVLHFELYKKESNFTNLKDSGSMKIGSGKSGDKYITSPIALDGRGLGKYQFNQYDWLFTFYPSGRKVTLRDINFHKRKERLYGDGMLDYICSNNLSFKMNDSTCSIPGKNGEHSLYMYLFFKY